MDYSEIPLNKPGFGLKGKSVLNLHPQMKKSKGSQSDLTKVVEKKEKGFDPLAFDGIEISQTG